MQRLLPRWRGFNPLEMFTTSSGRFQEDDFRWISDRGFDFVRIPACYLLWTKHNDPFSLNESVLEEMDRVVRFGEKYHTHICLNIRGAPGYSVNPDRDEPFSLWKDEEAREAFCFRWQVFAERYRGVPSERLSFNLVNEPPCASREVMTREEHTRVIRKATEAIRAVGPGRLVIADGISYGNTPCPELVELGIAQSCWAYLPMR